jgi:hypothetical protein
VIPSVAYRLECRWANSEPQPVTIYWATSRTAALFGGSLVGVKQPLQLEHDLLIGDVFTRYHREGIATQWHTEDRLRGSPQAFAGKLPDAAVCHGLGWTIVEIGGQYGSKRLMEFVTAMNQMQLAFEVW